MATTVLPPTDGTEWRSGGARTAVSAALGYGAGPVLFLTTASIFVKPTIEATGWSTTEVLIAPVLNFLFAALGPLVGRLVDRRGFRRILAIGLITYTVLLVLFATVPLSKVTFYGIAALLGFFGSFGYVIPYNLAVSSWFDKGAGKAFGLVGTGGAAMPLLAVPLVALAVYELGWRTGYLVLALFGLVIAIPAALLGVKERQAEQTDAPALACSGAAPVASRASAVLKSLRFWVFALSVLLVGSSAAAFLSNLQPILLDGGFSVPQATIITTVFTIGAIAGRLGTGILLDLLPRYVIAVTVLVISTLGALAVGNIAVVPFALVVVGTLTIAFSQGAEADFTAYFTLKEYGRENFGTILGVTVVMVGVGAIVGPFTFGLIRDATGSYTTACLLGAAGYLLGAAVMLVFGFMGRRAAGIQPQDS